MTLEPDSSGEVKYWWYNLRTGEVEHGFKSSSLDRVGPFETESQAKNALETLKRRSEEWRQDESEED